jgi:AraC-like DNA-binding protein
MELLMPPDAAVHARILTTSVGPLALGFSEISGCVSRCAPQRVPTAASSSYLVFLVLRGKNAITQDGRRAIYGRGDFGILDNSRPWISIVDDRYRALGCEIPHKRLSLPRDQVARITATVIPSQGGVGWAIGPYLYRLIQLAERGQVASDPHRIAQSTLDLIASLLHSQHTACARVRPRADLLEQIRAYIDANLGDLGLSPERIARAHYISRRYLDKLLQSEGTTVSTLVRQRRLERVRRQLVDPAFAHESISSIGTRWGLPNPAHLSRLFRDENGCSPSEYRA